MLNLLERNIAGIEDRLVLLTPAAQPAPTTFQNVAVDPGRHRRLVEGVQRLRGAVYLEDGAVTSDDLAPGGLHVTPQDALSWHLVTVDAQHEVSGCIWYLEHSGRMSFDRTRASRVPLAVDDEWGLSLRRAVTAEVRKAEAERIPYAEVGGWAVSKHSQCPAEGFLLAIAAYSLSRRLGGAIGLTTATTRHASATILRRLGLARFESSGTPIPSYFDPRDGCDMELLRFDSRRCSPKYDAAVELLKDRLAGVSVVSAVPALAVHPDDARRIVAA